MTEVPSLRGACDEAIQGRVAMREIVKVMLVNAVLRLASVIEIGEIADPFPVAALRSQ